MKIMFNVWFVAFCLICWKCAFLYRYYTFLVYFFCILYFMYLHIYIYIAQQSSAEWTGTIKFTTIQRFSNDFTVQGAQKFPLLRWNKSTWIMATTCILYISHKIHLLIKLAKAHLFLWLHLLINSVHLFSILFHL